jgi:flagellar hook-associated protein 2
MSSGLSALTSLLSGDSSSTGINLSAVLQAALGASTPGIDVNAAVSAAVTAAEKPETSWEDQLTTLGSQSSALTAIQSDAENLDADVQALSSLTGALNASTVTSSNSSVVTASAASGSVAGDTTVTVNSLATADAFTSNVFSNGSVTVPAGSFTITPPGGTTTTITSDGTDTLSDLARQINNAGLGVTANVIADATGEQLSIVSNTTGSASSFTVSGFTPSSGSSGSSSSLSFTQVPGTGTDASLTVNGIAVSSASNTVTGVVPGLTLNLLSTGATPVTLSTSADTTAASSLINQFVSDYNTLVTAVNAQYTVTNGTEGVLASDSTVQTLQSDLLSSVDYVYQPSAGSAAISSLSDLGISVTDNGTLSVNSTSLDDALQNNFNGVQSFFQGSAANGFANTLNQQLTNFTAPGTGAFTVDLQSLTSQATDLEDDINNFQSNIIEPLQTQLQAEYSQAEVSLQELPGEIKNVDAELGINTSNNNG